MTSFRLFRRFELAEAFALLLPQDDARRLASEWFTRFISPADVDDAGFFVMDQDAIPGGSSATTTLPDEQNFDDTDDCDTGGFEVWRSRSVGELHEYLMSLDAFHLALVAMVSPEAQQRLQIARGMSDAEATGERQQMLLIVPAMSRR